MGQRVLALAVEDPRIEVVGVVESQGHPRMGDVLAPNLVLGSDLDDLMRDAQVYIDFTTPESSLAGAAAASQHGVAAVVGTTGFTDEQRAAFRSACQGIPWILAPNMSYGVAVLATLVRAAAERLGKGYDVEIVETHHRRKADAPSGTALWLAEQVCAGRHWVKDKVSCFGRQGRPGPRSEDSIAVHAVRGGDVVGEHQVLFLGPGERIELIHRAQSRDTFAQGAIEAALFLRGRPAGAYEIADVVLHTS